MNAGTLEIQLAADVARLRGDMNKALNIVQKTARGFDDAAAQMRNALGGIGGGLSAAAFGMWIKSAIDFQDQLNDLNKTTDIAVSKLAGISLMSKQTGSDLTGMAQAMNKLTLEMGKAPEKFAKIGITAKDPLEAFKQLSDVFRKIEDPQLRAAVAAEALGKGWASAAPALAEGSEAIGQMIDRGEELAGITKLDAEMADAFNDALSELQTALMGTASNLAGSMLPLLTDLVKSLTDVTASANGADVGFNAITETLRALIVIGGNVAFVMHGIGTEIGGITAQAVAFGSGNFAQAAQIGRDMQADAAKRRTAFDSWQKSMMTAGSAAASLGDSTDALSRRMAANTKATTSAADAAKLKSFVDGAAAKKTTDDIKKAREEEEKFRIAWGRADSIRQGDAITKRNEEHAKSLEELAKAQAEYIQASVDALSAGVAEYENYGLLKSQITELTIAKLEAARVSALNPAELDVIDQQIANYTKLREIQRSGEVRDASKKTAEDAAKEWQKASDQISQSLTDALMEGGKSGADYIKGLFRTMVLQPIIKAAVQPVANAVTNSIGTGGGISNLSGIGNLAGGGMSMANSLGTSFANLTGGGIDALLATNGAFGTGAGVGATMMSGIGAALPWVGGALAIASLLESPRGGPKTEGGADIASSIQTQYDALAQQLGIKSGASFGAFSSQDTEGDALTQLQVQALVNGKGVYSREERMGGFENVERGTEALQAAAAEETVRAIFAAITNSDLEEKYRQYLNGVTDASGVDEMQAALTRLTTARTLEERLLELSSTEAENLARARQREMDAMDATLRPLLQQIYAQQDLRNAIDKRQIALDSAAKTEDDALNALDRAVQAQRTLHQAARDAASESVSALRSLFNLLGNSAADLYGQTAATRNAAAAQGSNFIAQALAAARGTGYLPDADQLTDAISAAQGGINGKQFRTVKEREFAQLVLAGQLGQLKEISGEQLTEAERTLRTADEQLRVLEQTYDNARAQLEATRGVSSSVLTMAQALAAFQSAMQSAAGVRDAAGATVLSNSEIAAWVTPRLGVSEASNREIYDAAFANRDRGVTLARIDEAGGLPPGTSASWAIANGLTPFAVGTNYVPRDMPAFLHQGEAVVPRAYNPAAGGTAANNERLERLFESLTAEVRQMRADTRRTAEAVNGRPDRPMLVETV